MFINLVTIRDCNILSISSSIEEDMASLLSTEILLYVTWGEEFPFINFIVKKKGREIEGMIVVKKI